jgi:hypothetical protein
MNVRRGWIQSPAYDLGLLSLSPLFGLLVCAAYVVFHIPGYVVGGVALFGFGLPHYLSTYTFFLDDTNAAYQARRKLAFYLGPVVVVAGLTLSLALHFYWFVAVVVDTWNVFHVSRQSAGILSVYRHLGGGDNRREKNAANLALIGVSAGLYAVFIASQPSFAFFFGFVPFPVATYLGSVLLVAGGVGLAVLLWRMRQRATAPAKAELIFLVSSLGLFLPFVLIESRSTASSAMLTGHYVQYLGLLWLLNHRKHAGATGSSRQQLLARASRSVTSILVLLATIIVATSIADRIVHHFNANAFHSWILNVIVLLHFYFDGLFWSFRQPEVRESVAPYLLLPDHRLKAA